MYSWVTHTHSHLGGECPHKCVYCYVDNPRFGRPKKYQGTIRLIENELQVKYGKGKTIFIENCNDLFAESVTEEFICRILDHTREFPENTYVFQSKNPERMRNFHFNLPDKFLAGTTIETNRIIPNISLAPITWERALPMIGWKARKFVTIEPIMDFDVDILAYWIARIDPEFVCIGADSKRYGLPEPPIGRVMALIDKLKFYGIDVREKVNLGRLRKENSK
jgi:protein gp37